MSASWIGLANQMGLQLLQRESPHLCRFLTRRTSRADAVCFWAILEDWQANLIREYLHVGEPLHALRVLEQLASQVGRVIPDEQDFRYEIDVSSIGEHSADLRKRPSVCTEE